MSFKNWIKKRDNVLYYEFISQDEFGEENVDEKKEIVVLVGPPAIGKSTYIAQKFDSDDVFIVSRDDIVDSVSSSKGFNYDEMFMLPPPESIPNTMVSGMEKYGLVKEAPSWMRWTKLIFSKVQEANEEINSKLQKRFKDAVESEKNIVVDMTNMTVNARKEAMKYAKDKDYFKRAVVFSLGESDLPELLRRMKERSAKIEAMGGKKTIGEDVIQRMIKSFEKIDPQEGFDKVDTFNSFSI